METINNIRLWVRDIVNNKKFPRNHYIRYPDGLTEHVVLYQNNPDTEVVFKKQNPDKDSVWAQLAQAEENTIKQVILKASRLGAEFEYLGVVINGCYLDYELDKPQIDEWHDKIQLLNKIG